jgi:DNA-binding NtrC family response regulator
LEKRKTAASATIARRGPLVEDSQATATRSRASTQTSSCPRRTLRENERHQIERALRETGGRVAKAAELLAIPRSTLYQKIREHGLPAAARQRSD